MVYSIENARILFKLRASEAAEKLGITTQQVYQERSKIKNNRPALYKKVMEDEEDYKELLDFLKEEIPEFDKKVRNIVQKVLPDDVVNGYVKLLCRSITEEELLRHTDFFDHFEDRVLSILSTLVLSNHPPIKVIKEVVTEKKVVEKLVYKKEKDKPKSIHEMVYPAYKVPTIFTCFESEKQVVNLVKLYASELSDQVMILGSKNNEIVLLTEDGIYKLVELFQRDNPDISI